MIFWNILARLKSCDNAGYHIVKCILSAFVPSSICKNHNYLYIKRLQRFGSNLRLYFLTFKVEYDFLIRILANAHNIS
jgi:hypothetical protein